MLTWHLQYCLQLLQVLGGRRVLKCKEAKTIDKLQRQADVIEHLVKIAKQNPGAQIRDLQAGTFGFENRYLHASTIVCEHFVYVLNL